ncbi:GNAT family N-acetyltransferase [Nocardioides sp. NPDC057772]|uniref:GNAT family N-acetyltransferase n=1 Tax=Nocardioides sp. NPDC057772 TaxID=3346245 RepID=UPI00366DF10A
MASSSAFIVTRVPAAETYPLRALVLHGGASPESAKVAGDDHSDVATFAAKDADGTVVGSVSVFPSTDGTWRIRRLATAEEWRGRGVGTAVLAAALAHADDHGGGTVWCNATPAGAPLFLRAGFQQVGAPWEDPEFGPNVRLVRQV